MRDPFYCKSCGNEVPWKGVAYSHQFCNNACQAASTRQQKIKEWLEEGKSWTTNIPAWCKAYLADTHGYKCSTCGISEWNGKPIVLEVDHIDGNHKNNVPSNLRLICPNCHSQTDTYKNKNKGNGRKYRNLPA